MADDKLLVRVKQGQLRGILLENVYGEHYLAFNGVPYAKPPVGPLRFKDPEPPEPWTGVRNASKYGGICAQFEMLSHKLVGGDDCLYLNVYRPVNDAPRKRAVMVWIHGGAFVNGSGDSAIYGPDYLIRKDIVLVTINYRLGVLGFLNIEHEVAPGNQGLKDQTMALKWVQENISNFSGDPDNVTIFGESAGGASVHYLTLSPLSQGLFHKAISQSGVVSNPWALSTVEPKKYVYQLAAQLGERSTDPKTVVEFLRTVDAQTLIIAEVKFTGPMDRYTTMGAFRPGIDDKSPNPFMPQHPLLMMEAGVKVPYIIGHNSSEGTMFLGRKFLSSTIESLQFHKRLVTMEEDFRCVIPLELQQMMKKEGISPQSVKRYYFGDDPINEKMIEQYASFVEDAFFLIGIYDVVDIQKERATQPTYLYRFSFDSESLMKTVFNITVPGATHADDLEYLFYPHIVKSSMEAPKVGSEKYRVMEYFTQMWTDFAKTGNPTPNATDSTTVWKPVGKSDTHTYAYLNINTTLRMETSNKKGPHAEWTRLKNKL
ncbi:juvenile hormone esterase [Xylocopa sonorina]|uniref:juvenile hormone esterase n=1 Tax=Xylocopa sonorina TaxID=1818115 RepID=UPI00403B3300